MHLLELTLATPAENLALDEALLEFAEEHAGAQRSAGDLQSEKWHGQETGHNAHEVLRLWESSQRAVVLGRSSFAAQEANVAECEALGIPILRRPSGGAAVMVGPGCLMYTLVLSYELRPELRSLAAVHSLVLGRIAEALRAHVPSVQLKGTSDLAFEPSGSTSLKKFSGNSLRCRRTHLLYHGTLLYNFPLELLAQCLGDPLRQPEYRDQRAHGAFVANLPMAAGTLRQAVIAAWRPSAPLAAWPRTHMERLLRERYSQSAWNFSR